MKRKYSSKMEKWFSYISDIKIKISIIVLGSSILSYSCSKLIKVDPPYTSINKDNIYDNDLTATAAVTDILAQLSNANFSPSGSISSLYLIGGLAADELSLYATNNTTYNVFYYNSLNENTYIGFWTPAYSTIYATNSVVEGLGTSTKLTNAVRTQLLGEAKFFRAFCYFYLTNLYGDLPLVLSTDAIKNANLSRSPAEKIYTQIIEDLISADSLLSEDYRSGNILASTVERIRPNKWSAKAMLARVYLYHGNYSLAENLASEVINKTSMYGLDSLDEVFLMNSHECILQLQNVYNTRGNTGEGNIFVLPQTGPNENEYPVYASHFLLDSFEPNDKRKTHWLDSVVLDSNHIYYFPYKYKAGALTQDGATSEYEMVLRLGEQYLIRAEARAQQGKINDAQSDLNVIRSRAGLNPTVASSKSDLLLAILHERQVELFTEWGHRWLDLKRTRKIDEVMKVVSADKGSTWDANWALWPIYFSEIINDKNLIQNPGY